MARKNDIQVPDNSALTTSSELNEEVRYRRILQQLQKILSNPKFFATKQQKNFLKFVVKEFLEGRSDLLKGYTIATQVFGRTEDFDPQSDPIVSVQANKLRRALEHFYLKDGKNDPIVIDIPKGTYSPVFIERPTAHPDGGTTDDYPDFENVSKWPTLLILPFKNKTENSDGDYLCKGLVDELALEISYFKNMKVLFPRERNSGNKRVIHDPRSRFKLSGNAYKYGNEIKITIHLEDTASGHHIWGETYNGSFDSIELTQYQVNIAKTVAAKISGDFGIVSRLILNETRHISGKQLSTYQAILRYYEYEQICSPESLIRAMEALTIAVKNDPGCGRIWTLLGLLYATIHNLGIPGFEKPLQKATEFTERGVSLEPNCQRVIGVLAFIRLCNNELAIAIDEVDRALRLNPNSLFVLDGLAYVLILSGDWDRGVTLAEKTIELNPYHRAILHDALWVNYLRVGKFNSAYHEAMYGRRPWLFWDPLIKSSTLGLLDQERDGREYAEKLLELRPDFPSHGRKLIRNYIKFEEIAELIEQGLQRVGIELN